MEMGSGGLSDTSTLNSRYNHVEIEPERPYRSSGESHCIGTR